jgi:glycosyltransferase involved in cell wall biosynthesis
MEGLLNDSPLISIVVPSFNQGIFLEQNLKSILSQSYKNYEIILLDGGSTDISGLVIDKYRRYFSHVRQEKDSGHYAAINEGFEMANGEIFMWLNSDDMLHSGSLDVIVRSYIKYKDDAGLFTGLPCTWDELGHLTSINHNPPSWGFDYFINMHLSTDSFMQQESSFFSRDLWESVGGLKCKDYPYAADFDLWLRMCEYSDVISLPYLIGGFRIHAQQRSHQYARYCLEAEKSRELVLSDALVLSRGNSKQRVVESRSLKNSFNPSRYIHCLPNAAKLFTSISPRSTQRQQDSISNWINNGFNVVSINAKTEVDAIHGSYPSVRFQEPGSTLEARFGKPYVPISELVKLCAENPSYSGIINSDIRFLSHTSAESVIKNSINDADCDNCLFIGSRIELVDVCSQLTSSRSTKGLSPLENGSIYSYGFDIFLASQSVWIQLYHEMMSSPVYGLGVPWWDYCLPFKALTKGIKLRNLHPPIIAHPFHPAQYSKEIWQYVGNIFALEVLNPLGTPTCDPTDFGPGFDVNSLHYGIDQLECFSREIIKYIHASAMDLDVGQSLRGPNPIQVSIKAAANTHPNNLHWGTQTPETFHRNQYGFYP